MSAALPEPDSEEIAWREHLDALDAEREERAWHEAEAQHKEERQVANINDAFPSKYMRAPDLKGKAFLLKIRSVDQETVGSDVRLVAYFDRGTKGLVLNKTNAQMIASKFGDDTDGWSGAEIELYPDKTQFNGNIVDCIRVRFPLPKAEEGDEIPF